MRPLADLLNNFSPKRRRGIEEKARRIITEVDFRTRNKRAIVVHTNDKANKKPIL